MRLSCAVGVALACWLAATGGADEGALPRDARGIFSFGSGAPCVGSDGTSAGVCLSRQRCSQRGGAVVGNCGVFGSCCSPDSCDARTDARSVVFSNPPYASAQPLAGRECSYTVDVNNDRVCQMRVDLEVLTLAQPNTTRASSTTRYPGFSCADDVFQIVTLRSFGEVVPPLCGENSGQHVYVRVDAALNQRTIRLSLRLADRERRPDLPQASWRIRVTQIECSDARGPAFVSILASERSAVRGDPPLRGGADGDREPDGAAERRARSPPAAARDRHLAAPAGCLQYYPDRSGTFESFNYNAGLGPYPRNLRYATCFRRAPDVCGVKLTAIRFRLPAERSANGQLDSDCLANPRVVGVPSGEDFLHIPEGQTADGLRANRWCGVSAQGQIVASAPPGPLYVYFNSDDLYVNGTGEFGYRFNYNTLNNCA